MPRLTALGPMPIRSSTGLLLLAAVVGGVTLTAQTAQAPAAQKPKPAPAAQEPAKPGALPSARTIIDRHIKETGGRAAILAHTSQHATGTISMPANGISGALDVYSAKPDKSLVKI